MTRNRWIVAAVALLALTVPAAGYAVKAVTPKPATIKVSAGEYFFKLGVPKTVKPGTKVTFVVKNTGSEAHDFDFTTLGKKTKYLGPGQSAKLVVTFKKKGRFTFICSVPRHAERGMAGAFVVK